MHSILSLGTQIINGAELRVKAHPENRPWLTLCREDTRPKYLGLLLQPMFLGYSRIDALTFSEQINQLHRFHEVALRLDLAAEEGFA